MYHRAWFNSVKPDFNTCFGMFPPILCLLIHSSSSDAAVELEGIDILCTRDLDVRFENNSRLRGWLMDVVIHDHPANVPLLARCMRLGATEISSHENNKVLCAHRAYMWDAFCS